MTRPEAHHDLPRKFRRDLEKAGLDIDDPRYGRWVEQHPHRQWSKALNKEWTDFFQEFGDPSQEQILRRMTKLRSSPEFPSIRQ